MSPEVTSEVFLNKPRSLEELALELSKLDPRPVTHFTPDNLDDVMADFLRGRRRNPDNATYSKLDGLDFEQTAVGYADMLDEVRTHPGIPPKHHHVYESFVQRSIDINELMQQAVLYRTAPSEASREKAEKRFKELNKKLYGEPHDEVASAMVREVLEDSSTADNAQLVKIRQEFVDLLPDYLVDSESAPSKLSPSPEARETISRAVEIMYSPLLKHADELMSQAANEQNVPESKLKVDGQGIAVIFQTIIDEEFPESGWKVLLTQTNAINVDPATKTIRVPEDRRPATANKVRGLVVHELGVHMVRSIIGEKADLIPLRFGASGGGEAEEGIAKVMESAITDDTPRTGYQHYLTASLLGKGYDFRDAFEVMWRYKALDTYLNKPTAELSETFVEEQKREAFKFMFRSIRGTNYLPWHMTLSYFNGTHKMWEYVEKHKGSPDFITIMFMGKIDPTKEEHLQGAFDAKAKV